MFSLRAMSTPVPAGAPCKQHWNSKSERTRMLLAPEQSLLVAQPTCSSAILLDYDMVDCDTG